MFNLLNFSPDEIKFWSGFLDKYHELKCLWSKSKMYTDKDRYRIERQSAYLQLLQYCRIKYPKADVNFVTQKLQNFGSLFKKNYNKVIKCREQGVTFNPNLWYYKKMLFLIEDELNEDITTKNQTKLSPVIITRIHEPKPAATEPLFQTENSIQSINSKNIQSVSNINGTDIKIEQNDENRCDGEFEYCDSSENILNNLPIINTANCNNYIIENIDSEHSDTYLLNSIDIIEDNTNNNLNLINENNDLFTESRKIEKSIKRKRKKSKMDSLTRITLKEVQKLSNEDEYDAAGRKFAYDLRGMSQEQKNLTEKIISDVIYNGKCNLLKSSYIFKPSSDITITDTINN